MWEDTEKKPIFMFSWGLVKIEIAGKCKVKETQKSET
jgi:hypothetical protein